MEPIEPTGGGVDRRGAPPLREKEDHRPAEHPPLLEMEIWRGGSDGRFRTYRIPRRPSQTVLDAVTEVQSTLDSTLAYRFACRVGMCGSCAMMVNDRPRWTCRTRVAVAAPRGKLKLAPLLHLPIVKDLVVDMTPFFDKWQRARGRFDPGPHPATEFAVVPPASSERLAADAGIECIGCGVCYAACDVVGWSPNYLGPAALNRAWTLMNDVRDQDLVGRLAAVTGFEGCQECHSHMACTETCPKRISPTYSIAGLKRLAMRSALGTKR